MTLTYRETRDLYLQARNDQHHPNAWWLKSLYITDHGTLRSSSGDLYGGIALSHLTEHPIYSKLPDQQRQLIQGVREYYQNEYMFPYLGTLTGRAPSKHTRGAIVAVMMAMLFHLDFYTWRVGRLYKGRYHDISVLELAKTVGFSYIDDNGREQVEKLFLRAYQLICTAYVHSHQSHGRTLESRSGWKCSAKFLSEQAIYHIIDAIPGLMSDGKLEELKHVAKTRHQEKGAPLIEAMATRRRVFELATRKAAMNARLLINKVTNRLVAMGFAKISAREAGFHLAMDQLKHLPERFGIPEHLRQGSVALS